MKWTSIILAGMLSFSANAFDWNEAYGTHEGVSSNYVATITSDKDFYVSDEAHQAAIDEGNGYFTAWKEAVYTWNEQNGYWDE